MEISDEKPFHNNHIVGKNKYYKEGDFENYPEEIIRSPTNRYFLIFQKDNLLDNAIFEKELEFLEFENFEYVTSDNINQDSAVENFSRTVFVYPEFKLALAVLSDEQLGLINSKENLFTVQPERIIQGVYRSVDLDAEDIQEEEKGDWGIDLVKANETALTGRGVKVAVLDTGFQINHPDYVGRTVVRKAFIGDKLDDDHGHGMHTTGIAFGFKDVDKKIRYGIAHETEIYAGKILNSSNRGKEADILNGTLWALANDCQVILLCVEIPNNGHGYPDDYVMHQNVQDALENRSVFVVAAAGNSSNRSIGIIHPLGKPASYQYTIAVGAVGRNLNILNFSNQAKLFQTMQYVGPGERIYSSWSTNGRPSRLRRRVSGTSMAAPFVAGVLALMIQQNPQNTGLIMLNSLNLITNPKWNIRDYGNGIPVCPK